eukprot:446288-Rhodomonas_salina.1
MAGAAALVRCQPAPTSACRATSSVSSPVTPTPFPMPPPRPRAATCSSALPRLCLHSGRPSASEGSPAGRCAP